MSTKIPYSPHWPIISVLLGTHAHIQCPHSVHCRNLAMAACLSCNMVLAAKGDPSTVTLSTASPSATCSCVFLPAVSGRTGQGKTLAFVLPIVERLLAHNISETRRQQGRTPRVIVLAPTRELAKQVCPSLSPTLFTPPPPCALPHIIA